MKYILFFFLLLTASALTAQTPQAINYQGIARTTNGNPIADKAIALRMSIRQGSPTGIAIYSETHHVTTNRLGLFAIELGRGNVSGGQFDNISWGASSHFVEVELDENGGQNFISLGTSPFLSVPYALYAAKAKEVDGLWNQNAVGIDFTDGRVGIGTDFPHYSLDISNNEPGGFERFQINLQNRSESDRSFAGMLMSSGTGSGQTSIVHHAPSYMLEGDKLSDHGQLLSTGKGLIIRVDNPEGVIKFLAGYEAGYSPPERMRIDAEGNVGIGTELPVTKLQVTNGDVFIENINSGVIMKSPNNSCWRITVNNDGSLKSTSIPCPN